MAASRRSGSDERVLSLAVESLGLMKRREGRYSAVFEAADAIVLRCRRRSAAVRGAYLTIHAAAQIDIGSGPRTPALANLARDTPPRVDGTVRLIANA